MVDPPHHARSATGSAGAQAAGARRGSATVGGSPSRDPVLGQLAHLAAVALDFDQGRILLRERRGTTEPATGGDRPTGGDKPDPGRPAGPWSQLDALVREGGTAVVLNDVAAAPAEFPRSPLPGAYVAVPIWVGDDVEGVLRLTDAEPRSIPVRQVRLLVEFSRTIGLYLRPGEVEHEIDHAAADLARALSDGEIVPWYQPIVELAGGRVIGVEALARWRRPNGRFESPASFIPVAERSDLIIDLDFAVMRQAMADLTGWQRTAPDFRLSLNLSGRHLDQSDWLDRLTEATTAAALAPGSIDLELTETARPTDIERGWVMIEKLRAVGYTVWFDDFGAGYYDLQDLVRLPVDGLKIDRSFADQLDQPINDALVSALTAAAARVGIKVTIEGIETPRQAELARALGCHFAQGFYWSRPVPAGEVEPWLTATGGIGGPPAAPG